MYLNKHSAKKRYRESRKIQLQIFLTYALLAPVTLLRKGPRIDWAEGRVNIRGCSELVARIVSAIYGIEPLSSTP